MSNTVTMELTPDEVKLLEGFRKSKRDAIERIERRKNCNHDFQYSGHGHNDDCYECSKCGELEWR